MTSPLQLYDVLLFFIFLQQHLAKLTLCRHVKPMRFVLTLSLMTLLSPSASAAPWDIVPLAETQNPIGVTTRPVQMQRGGSSNTLQTIKGLDLNITATGLGQISAMALGEDDTLFTADARTGRLWALTDRGQDGKIDMRRPLPYTFKTPTGLALIGSTLYVADQNAVWIIEAGNAPRELASLKQANSTGEPHILLANPNGTSLTLGLTTQTQGHRILELDAQTGQASLIGEGQTPLHALAQRAGSEIWAASGAQLSALGAAGLNFQTGQAISSIALPGQYETPQDWPSLLQDHIFTAQAGPGAMRLIAIPTEFGQASGAPRVLVEGFLTRSGHSAWGQPGAIIMDKRGLFLADKENGTIWRLSPTPQAKPKITIVDTASLPTSLRAEPSLDSKDAIKIESTIKGTQIDASSTIIKPSNIEYGSKIIKDYDEKKALEDAGKTDEEPKKERRRSRKRKQADN